MTPSEKLARRLARHCVSVAYGNRWFNKNKAATVIEAAFADVTERAEKAEKENARLMAGIARLESWQHRLSWVADQEKFLADLEALLQLEEPE